MDGRMDRQMDGQTDTTSYKMSIWFPCNALQLEKKMFLLLFLLLMLLMMVLLMVVVVVVVVVVFDDDGGGGGSGSLIDGCDGGWGRGLVVVVWFDGGGVV